jgi:hypothetical protein
VLLEESGAPLQGMDSQGANAGVHRYGLDPKYRVPKQGRAELDALHARIDRQPSEHHRTQLASQAMAISSLRPLGICTTSSVAAPKSFRILASFQTE